MIFVIILVRLKWCAVTEVIEAGDYVMIINHDGKKEKTHPIFIIPGRSGEQAAQRIDTNKGLFKSAKSQFSKIINNFHNIITQKAKAQTVAENVKTLLSTNKCIACDLTGALMPDANLTNANLTNANLTFAELTGANLSRANLFSANLTGATAFLANLTDANLTIANLTDANLTGAIWCDGSRCSTGGSRGGCETGARFMDNCDGTISDADTDLMWEKKVPNGPFNPDPVSCALGGFSRLLHSVLGKCGWFEATEDWITQLNNTCNSPISFVDTDGGLNIELVDCSVGGDADCMNAGVVDCCGFACHRDWRLPKVSKDTDAGMPELETIADCNHQFTGACIDPIFGPTFPGVYWSSTTVAPQFTPQEKAWFVNFNNGFVLNDNKNSLNSARAVRTIK